jgi:hypothetical protein
MSTQYLRAPDKPGYWWVWHLAPPEGAKPKWIGVYVPNLQDGSGLLRWQETAAQRPTYWTPSIQPPDPREIPTEE